MSDPPAGSSSVLGAYRLERELGKGGMGVVYLAFDQVLERRVAIKIIAPAVPRDPKAQDRFIKEARILAKFQHPHVLPVYHVEAHEGRVYLVMRFADGPTLRGLLERRARLAPGHAMKLLAQIGDALDAVHRHNVVHGDVKPENILLEGFEGD